MLFWSVVSDEGIAPGWGVHVLGSANGDRRWNRRWMWWRQACLRLVFCSRAHFLCMRRREEVPDLAIFSVLCSALGVLSQPSWQCKGGAPVHTPDLTALLHGCMESHCWTDWVHPSAERKVCLDSQGMFCFGTAGRCHQSSLDTERGLTTSSAPSVQRSPVTRTAQMHSHRKQSFSTHCAPVASLCSVAACRSTFFSTAPCCWFASAANSLSTMSLAAV